MGREVDDEGFGFVVAEVEGSSWGELGISGDGDVFWFERLRGCHFCGYGVWVEFRGCG